MCWSFYVFILVAHPSCPELAMDVKFKRKFLWEMHISKIILFIVQHFPLGKKNDASYSEFNLKVNIFTIRVIVWLTVLSFKLRLTKNHKHWQLWNLLRISFKVKGMPYSSQFCYHKLMQCTFISVEPMKPDTVAVVILKRIDHVMVGNMKIMTYITSIYRHFEKKILTKII